MLPTQGGDQLIAFEFEAFTAPAVSLREFSTPESFALRPIEDSICSIHPDTHDSGEVGSVDRFQVRSREVPALPQRCHRAFVHSGERTEPRSGRLPQQLVGIAGPGLCQACSNHPQLGGLVSPLHSCRDALHLHAVRQ